MSVRNFSSTLKSWKVSHNFALHDVKEMKKARVIGTLSEVARELT